MKLRNLAATLLAMTLSLGAFQAAFASPPPGNPPVFLCNLSDTPTSVREFHDEAHDCRIELHAVILAIIGLDGLSTRDVDRLTSKVCAADGYLHLDKDKTLNANQKLGDVSFKVTDNPKIDDNDEAEFNLVVAAAQTCISDI